MAEKQVERVQPPIIDDVFDLISEVMQMVDSVHDLEASMLLVVKHEGEAAQQIAALSDADRKSLHDQLVTCSAHGERMRVFFGNMAAHLELMRITGI